jgi:two-component system sensor histidine kinase HydH
MVIDYRLPDTDGLDLVRSLRLHGFSAPFLVITAADSLTVALEALDLGAETFVQKQEGYLDALGFLIRQTLERIRARAEKERLESELRKTERLASLGVLAAGLAHNINNRLTSLKAFFDVFPHHHHDAEMLDEFSKVCEADLEKIAMLIDELTRYALADSFPLPMQPIAEPIERAVEHLEDQAQRRGLRITTSLQSVPEIPLDPEGIKQLFISLLGNAIEASPEGGEVRVALRLEGGDHPQVVVDVEDDGPGIAASVSEHLFEPFVTTKAHGLGIGLYICRKIAGIHHGRLELTNRPGGGATFSVLLPVRLAAGREAPMRG